MDRREFDIYLQALLPLCITQRDNQTGNIEYGPYNTA